MRAFMSTPATKKFTYSQIMSLALQLSDAERAQLCRDLTLADRAESFGRLSDLVAPCDLTDDEIREECESVRQEMYEARIAKK